MNTFLEYTHRQVFPSAFSLLPHHMDSHEARALLLAIGLQESKFEHRRQLDEGPARGFWQFERSGGVLGVLSHQKTSGYAKTCARFLHYTPTKEVCWVAIEHNDVLACIFARLLLWTVPGALPGPDQSQQGWDQYIAGWRPGKPHPESWFDHYRQAWQVVNQEVLSA